MSHIRKILQLSLLIPPLVFNSVAAQEFTYHQVDDKKTKWGDYDAPDWLRYFGLDYGDVNGDGLMDILTGRNVYLQPQNGNAPWQKLDLGVNVDGFILTDVDGDEHADIIGMALPSVYWLEANGDMSEWSSKEIANVPATSHTNSQGFTRTDITGDGTDEILIAGNGDIYTISIPANPENSAWPVAKIGINTSDEGIGVGDIDGDGDMDIAAGRRPEGGDEPLIIVWFENPGSWQEGWTDREVGTTNHPADRVLVADFDLDGNADILVAEERWPGEEPDGNIFWYQQQTKDDWTRKHIVTQYSSNNLDVLDFDSDGDFDFITAEHKGPRLELQLWLNDGSGLFSKTVLDTGKENHLGVRAADMDGDGDMDIIGIGWDKHEFVHFWRNEAK